MADEHTSESESSPVMAKNSTVDAVVAVILFIFGAVVIYQARILGSGWTSDGPGSGYFPFYVGLIICISALGVFYQAKFSKHRDTGDFVDRVQLTRVASVLLPALVYVLGILFLGLYVASAIYIILFMIVLGKYPPVKSVILAVVINTLFFLMFEVWFKVPLYKGKLEPLSFLGY